MSDVSRATLRRLLGQGLRTASDMDAFILDYFPSVYRRFSSGMDRTQRENLLLTLAEPGEIVSALRSSAGPDLLRQIDAVLLADAFDPSHTPEPGPRTPSQLSQKPESPPLLFIEYEQSDALTLDALLTHLKPLTRRGQIAMFHRGMVGPGENIKTQLENGLAQAAVIALLVSPDLLASPDFEDSLRRVLRRQREGVAVIPVLVRPALWESTPLGRLRALPMDGRPLSVRSTADRAAVLADIAKALVGRLETTKVSDGTSDTTGQTLTSPIAAANLPQVNAPADATRPDGPISLAAIFPRKAGTLPKYTLVEPEHISAIRDELRDQLGLGLLVEGPSGVGKTTAVRRAFELLQTEPNKKLRPAIPYAQHWIHARNPEDVTKLEKYLSNSFREGGYLVIDDFHRLTSDLQAKVADLIKFVADHTNQEEGASAEQPASKIIVIGINPIGRSLLRGGKDLSGRYSKITLGRLEDHYIRDLIEKGEQIANIRFQYKPDIIEQARGSLYIAQMLCYFTAKKDGVTEAWPLSSPKMVSVTPEHALEQIQQQLDDRFGATLRSFASFGWSDEVGQRGATLALLALLRGSIEKLAAGNNPSERGTTSLDAVANRYHILRDECDWLGGNNLGGYFDGHPELQELFYYDRNSKIISAEDPQIYFYLRKMDWPAFIRDTGHDHINRAGRSHATWTSTQELWFTKPSESPTANSVLQAAQTMSMTPNQSTASEANLVSTQVKLKLPISYILHLSDLHFSSASQVNPFLDALEADIDELKSKIPRIDGIVLSGDLTERADRAEFDAAADFLRSLRDSLGLGPQQLVIVPGNHDGSWQVSKDSYPADVGDSLSPAVPAQPRPDVYARRFEAFADFYQEVLGQPYPLEFSRQATLHPFAGQKLLFLGLNSAWQTDHIQAHRGRASINSEALSLVLRAIRREPTYLDWLKIAVFHHPVQSDGEDRIKNTGFLDRLTQAGFRLALHGHMHAAQQLQHAYDVTSDGRKLRVVGAGTFGAPTKEWRAGVPLQYQILCIGGDKLTVRSRCRSNPEGTWQADGRWRVGEDVRSFYDIDL